MEDARVATAADIPALKTLWDMAVREIDTHRGGALLLRSIAWPAPFEQGVQAALGDADRVVVLGTTDGVEVGFASVRCDLAGRPPIGVIDAVYVEPSARQIGVGEAIVDLVISWCRERGCGGVDAPALPGSRPAKAFFEDHGFIARLLVMHHPLPGPAAREDG
jgi:GNAT superfamily N-acetyltransferase